MLPAVIVTLATFLLELCSSSPVYNMQPAFITNTLGATTGRNIRNLPCVSRKNNNLHGVCMFAIDCVKSNGTHLGTCIDRFYFGSCCLVPPVPDIIENTIESDIIPHREPPLRISNTTSTSPVSSTTPSVTTASTANPEPVTTEKVLVNSTDKVEEKTQSSISSDYKLTETSTVGSSTTEATTTPQKLQTFQVVHGSTTNEVTIKPPSTTPKPSIATENPTKSSTTTPKPTKSSTTTPKPTKASTTTKPIKISTTTSKPATPKPVTKPKPLKVSTTTSKPIKTTRPAPTKPTSKPTKPVRVTSTKKPVSTQASTTTPKPTATTTTPTSTTTAVPTSTTQKIEDVTLKHHLVLTTTVSNEIPLTKINVSQILETVNGNPATNEIEATKPVAPLVTPGPETKPGLVTWTVADPKNHTEAPTTEAVNVTEEEWLPLTTPEGWVLLPSLEPNSTVSQTIETTSSPVLLNSSVPSSSVTSTTTVSSTTTATEKAPTSATTTTPSMTTSAKPVTTYIPLGNISESVTPSFTTLNATTVPPTSTTNPEATSESSTTLASDRPVNMSDFTDVCGRRMYPEARIVGGEKSAYGRWPWQISLRQWRTSTYLHKCGAALLNENWAITAAHCVDQVPPSELLLRLGEHDLSTEAEPYLHQERRVQIVASHPQFDPRTFEYDLALLRFYEPVNFQPNILPVCVPQTNENFVGRTAYVTGWGRLYENGPLPSVLQEVSVPVINNSVCETMYRSAGYIEHIPHIFICAGWRRGGFDSCEGDSGGPMVIQREDKRFLLAGVISWGIGCAEPNQPGVYTRISEFRDWINQILQF